MAIDNTTVVPQVIAAAFLVAYRKARVFSERTNNTWRSSLQGAGDTVIINQPGSASVTDYTAGGTVTYKDADVGDPIQLSINKIKSWALKFDDLRAAMSSLPVLTQQVQEQAQELADQVDIDVRETIEATDNATIGSSTVGANAGLDLTGLNLTDTSPSLVSLRLNRLHRMLDDINMPLAGRWIICGPAMAEFVRNVAVASDRILAGPRDSLGNQIMNNGVMGSFAGFTWYVSNNVLRETTTKAKVDASGTKRAFPAVANGQIAEAFYAGNDTATAFVDQVDRTEFIRLQTTFADAIRGLYSYGSKVIKRDRVLRSTAVFTNAR